MNGHDLERVLSLIDENIGANQARLRSEIIRYIEENEEQVLAQLRSTESANIPTSVGDVTLNLADLREVVA